MAHEIKEHIIAQTHNVIIKSIKNVKIRDMIISKFMMAKTFMMAMTSLLCVRFETGYDNDRICVVAVDENISSCLGRQDVGSVSQYTVVHVSRGWSHAAAVLERPDFLGPGL